MGSLWETTHKDIWEDICFFTHRHRWQCLELAVGTWPALTTGTWSHFKVLIHTKTWTKNRSVDSRSFRIQVIDFRNVLIQKQSFKNPSRQVAANTSHRQVSSSKAFEDIRISIMMDPYSRSILFKKDQSKTELLIHRKTYGGRDPIRIMPQTWHFWPSTPQQLQ